MLQAGQSNSLLAFHRKMLRDKPLGGIGGLIFALFLFCGLFADLIAPYGMNETDMRRVLQAPSLRAHRPSALWRAPDCSVLHPAAPCLAYSSPRAAAAAHVPLA